MSRIDSLVGSVVSVDDVLAGSVLRDDHAAGELVLRVVDAADFAEAGGNVDVDGTLYGYSSADLDTDVLTLTDPLLAAVDADTPAHVAPRSPSRLATVTVEGRTDGLTVHVPQSLLDQVPTGLRGQEDAETVLVDLVDGQWQLVDLVAVPSRAMDAETVTQIVMDTADGLRQQSFRFVAAEPAPLPDPPSTDGRREGDSHHDVTIGTGVVRAAYILTSDGAWTPHRFGDEVLDSVAAGKILGGVITALLDIGAGGQVTAGVLETGGRAFMRGGTDGGIGFEVPAEDGTTPITVAQMGRDWVARDDTGQVTASITGHDGAVTGQTGDFSELRVAGRDVGDELDNIPSLIVNDDPGLVSRGPYSDGQVGYRTVGFTSKPGHIYEIDARLHVVNESDAARTHITYLRVQHGSAGNTSVQATISSPDIASDDGTISSGQEGRFRMSGTFTHRDAREVRLLVSARNTGTGGLFRFVRSVITVKDLGRYEPQVTSGQWSLGGGSANPGAPPTPPPSSPPPQKHRRYYDFDWAQVFQTFGRANPNVGGLGSRLRQGRIGAVNSTYPYGTLLRIPDDARAAVMGASKVRAWIQLTNIGWVDGAVIVGQSTATTNPQQFPTPIGIGTAGSLPRGATRLLPLPVDWESRWQAGANRSLTLGRVDSTGNNDRLLDFQPITGPAGTRARLYLEWEA